MAGRDEVGAGWGDEEVEGFGAIMRAAEAAVGVGVEVAGAAGALILVLMRLNKPPFVEGGGEATTVAIAN